MHHALISKEFHLSASHVVEGLPDGHQCGRLHGHNYIFRIGLEGEVIHPGFVVDYGELAPIRDRLDELDHRHLNDLLDFNPTAENLALYVAEKLVRPVLAKIGAWNVDSIQVAVSETPKTWATVRIDA